MGSTRTDGVLVDWSWNCWSFGYGPDVDFIKYSGTKNLTRKNVYPARGHPEIIIRPSPLDAGNTKGTNSIYFSSSQLCCSNSALCTLSISCIFSLSIKSMLGGAWVAFPCSTWYKRSHFPVIRSPTHLCLDVCIFAAHIRRKVIS